jgi:hypothetical protein
VKRQANTDHAEGGVDERGPRTPSLRTKIGLVLSKRDIAACSECWERICPIPCLSAKIKTGMYIEAATRACQEIVADQDKLNHGSGTRRRGAQRPYGTCLGSGAGGQWHRQRHNSCLGWLYRGDRARDDDDGEYI